MSRSQVTEQVDAEGGEGGAGKAPSDRATYMKSRLSDSMLPQAAVGGCTPNPRTLIAASATMELGEL